MKIKCGDSNHKAQGCFFKPQIKKNDPDKHWSIKPSREQLNQHSFYRKSQQQSKKEDLSLQVTVLLGILSQK